MVQFYNASFCSFSSKFLSRTFWNSKVWLIGSKCPNCKKASKKSTKNTYQVWNFSSRFCQMNEISHLFWVWMNFKVCSRFFFAWRRREMSDKRGCLFASLRVTTFLNGQKLFFSLFRSSGGGFPALKKGGGKQSQQVAKETSDFNVSKIDSLNFFFNFLNSFIFIKHLRQSCRSGCNLNTPISNNPFYNFWFQALEGSKTLPTLLFCLSCGRNKSNFVTHAAGIRIRLETYCEQILVSPFLSFVIFSIIAQMDQKKGLK